MAAKVLPVAHDDDYSMLKDLKMEFEREGSFSLCFWLFLLSSTRCPVTIIQQMHSAIEGDVPFLILDEEKRLKLLPLMFLHEEAPRPGNSTSWTEVPCASAASEISLEKWVHVGCEVSNDFMRLHIDGVVVGEKPLSSSLKNGSNPEDLNRVTLSGTDGGDGKLQGYVHNVLVLPLKSSIKDHSVKNPPLQLSIDSSCASEIEEGSDGVWSIVGGKASCRRNFSLDVVLLDALGQPVNKEIEVFASLLYADNGMPVEKPKDAEAPLLTSYDGIEFASFDRPSKLLHGRAAFKLKISQISKMGSIEMIDPTLCMCAVVTVLQLSSKCDNRLFRIRFDSQKMGRYPFLEAYSRPIRCISRNRNSRTSSMLWKKTTAFHPLDGPQSLRVDDGSPETHHNNGNGHFPVSNVCESIPSPPPKRVKVRQDKFSVMVQADPAFERSHDECDSHALNANQGENLFGTSLEGKHENLEGTDNTPSDSESVEARNSALKKVTSIGNPISDLTIFKYCLGGINERTLLLKEVATSATDQEMSDFAQQISLYTGCSHHRYQILIAKRLVEEGINCWNLISQHHHPVLWENAVFEIEEQFMKISQCTTRGLSEQDFELLRRIAGCRDYLARENFDRMWYWLYPIAFTLSRDWINAMWGCTSPMSIEGLITKEEAESSLRSSRGLQEPGTFILRFPTSRSWPHPDAGSLIVTYVGTDYNLHHRLLSLDYSCGNKEINQKPLLDLLLSEPQLSRLGRVMRSS